MSKRIRVGVVWLFFATAFSLFGQPSDRCGPGWSLLTHLREQLTPDTSNADLEDWLSRAETRAKLCPAIPDLWYYRYLIAQRLKNKDAAYFLKKATEYKSEALRVKDNPFEKAPAPDAEPPLSPTIHDKWALVVGIGEFQDTAHVQALRYTVDDANAFGDYLGKTGGFSAGHVIRLLNSQATTVGIRSAIAKLRTQVREDDLVVVYMASHGAPTPDDPNGVSFIITYDTKLDSPDNLYLTSLVMSDLVTWLKRDIKARRLVLVLDTCYSGDATNARGTKVNPDRAKVGAPATFSVALNKFVAGGPKVVLAASRADQLSWETDTLKHGYFTYFLLQSLQEHGGQIPIEKAFEQARDYTKEAVWKDHHAEQVPNMQQSGDGGAIVIAAPSGS